MLLFGVMLDHRGKRESKGCGTKAMEQSDKLLMTFFNINSTNIACAVL
jgi:hypothetical protein